MFTGLLILSLITATDFCPRLFKKKQTLYIPGGWVLKTLSRKKRKSVSEEGKSPGKKTLTRSKRMKFKMHRIKTQRRSDRITELDQILSRVFAVSWVIWRFSSLCGWAEVSFPCQLSMPFSTYLNYYKGNNVTKLCMSFET